MQKTVDYYMSCVPADRPRADVLALYLSHAGVGVFRLWADMGSLTRAELEQRVSESPAMIVVLSDNYMDDLPWEWGAFSGVASGMGGYKESHAKGKTLVLVELLDMQMGALQSSDTRFVVIRMHNMGIDPQRDEREFLAGLGIAAPDSLTAPSPSQQGQVFCHHCGAANPTGTAQCFACHSSLVAGAPANAGRIAVPSAAATVSSGGAVAPATNTQAGATTTTYCDSCGEPNRSSALYCRVCGKPMSGPVAAPAGATGLLGTQTLLLQRYLVLASVGKGGFGAVYKVADTKFGDRLLAVKEMSQQGLDAAKIAEATDAFEREALLLAGLMNPHLPRIYDHFSEGGRWYLVMDFIEGQTLEDHLTGPLLVEEALDLAQQVCDALAYLHKRQPPVIFRDLKPANIMRTDEGHVYLIDFGIARHFKPGKQRDTVALGSPGYAAPEQYGKKQTSARSDLYSLGALLHQLLSGDDPSESPFHFRPLGKIGRAFPEGLALLVAMLLDMDADKRPESAQLVKKALVSIAAGKGLPPELQTPGQAPAGTGQASRAASTGAPAVANPAGQSAGAALCVYREHARRVRAASLSPDGQQVASVGDNSRLRIWEAPSGRTLHDIQALSPLRAVAWSPDGSSILTGGVGMAFKSWNPTTGQNAFRTPYIQPGVGNAITALAWSGNGNKYVLATDQGVVIVGSWLGLEDTFYGNRSLSAGRLEGGVAAFSPDAALVAAAGSSGAVQIWAVGTSQTATAPRQTYRGHQREVCALAWSPGGGLLASADIEGGVHLWEAGTGKRLFTYSGHGAGQPVRSLAFSPDGRLIASGGDDSTVQVWEPSTGQVLATYRDHTARVNTVAWSGDSARLVSASDDGTVRVWQVSAGLASPPPFSASAIAANPPQPFAASPAARQLPAVEDLVAGDDEGPMDLLRWVARMLLKSPRPSTTYFSVGRSQAVVRCEGSQDFVLSNRLGGGETFRITSLADPELGRLTAALRGQRALPEQIQGLSLDYDPGVNTFKN